MVSAPTTLAAALPYLPAGSWLSVHASAPDGRFLDLQQPAITYPDAEVRIFVERGKPMIGIYRVHARELPAAVARIADQPIGLLPNVQRIDIATRAAATEPELELIAGGRPAPLVDLGDSRRGKPLAEVLAGLRGDRIRIVGAESELVLQRSQVDADPAGFTLKRTHRGIYVFRSTADELRGVRRIVVE